MSIQEIALMLVDAMTFISVVALSAGATFLLAATLAYLLRS
jgi:hypothetical protein